MASTATRLWRYLPGFLKRKADGEMSKVVTAAGGTADTAHEEIKLLPARSAANRFDGEFASYYAGTDRQDDVARLAQGRLLAKLRNESWEEFEERLRAFFGLETWDGSVQRYSRIGDVAQLGCFSGMEREIERTGLEVDSMYGGLQDPLSWQLLAIATAPPIPDLDQSMILEIGTVYVPDPAQRQTRIYSGTGRTWTIWITLTNPSVVTYTEDEVKAIVRLSKPAWARAYVMFPSGSYWTLVE